MFHLDLVANKALLQGRLYWRLSKVLGVIVEDIDHNKWLVIDDSDLLNEVLVS